MKKNITGLGYSPKSGSAARGLLAMGLLLAALLVTSACGFRLRGDMEIPSELSPVFVQAQQGSPVDNEIIQQLRESQVQLTAEPRQARMLIRIGNEQYSSRVAVVDRSGKALAQELYYSLTFDVVTSNGKQLVPQQSLNLVRSYEDPGKEVLGKHSEGEMIYADMFSDAAHRILSRLWAALL